MSYGTQLGKLSGTHSARSSGKKIDTWTFHDHQVLPLGVGAKGPAANTVEVYLIGTTLQAQGPALPPGNWTDTDVGRLHARVEQVLVEQATLRAALRWEPYLEVQTHLGLPFREEGRSLTISYRELLRGTRASHPNEAWTLNTNQVIVPFPTAMTPTRVPAEAPDACFTKAETAEALGFQLGRRDQREPGDTYAYVSDTPATRAALDRLCQAMDGLGAQLHDLLSPARAEAAMQRINRGDSLLAMGGPKAA